MRMTDRQVEELKTKFEALAGTTGACMDCDDHPDDKLDGFCSEAHRAEGYASTVVGLAEELLRYKALAKKHELPEPRADEATTPAESDDDRDKRLATRLANLMTVLGTIRDEHETQLDGNYHRCGCDLCTAHRRMEDPNFEIDRLTKDLAALTEEYEELCQTFDEGVQNGNNIRVDLTRAVGIFTKSPGELVTVVAKAVNVALKNTEFKAFYDERQRTSRARTLEHITRSQELKQVTKDFEKLSKELEVIENVIKTNPHGIDPSVVKGIRDQHTVLAQKLAEARGP